MIFTFPLCLHLGSSYIGSYMSVETNISTTNTTTQCRKAKQKQDVATRLKTGLGSLFQLHSSLIKLNGAYRT